MVGKVKSNFCFFNTQKAQLPLESKVTKPKLKETSAPMCNDTLELLRIKDENIKYINQEIDAIIKGKKSSG